MNEMAERNRRIVERFIDEVILEGRLEVLDITRDFYVHKSSVAPDLTAQLERFRPTTS